MKWIRFLSRYFFYLLHSHTRYGVHSPFVYDLLTKAIYGREKRDLYRDIETLRREMLSDHSVVEIMDYGTGGRDGMVVRKKVNQIASSSAQPSRNARLLARLVKYFSPSCILELGTSLGISTAYMASARPEARVYTLEGCPNLAGRAGNNFKTLGLENIEVIRSTFEEVLDRVLENIPSLDFVFIDGNHTCAATLEYLDKCLRHAHPDTVLVLDDIHWSDEMERAWEIVRKDPRVIVTVDLFRLGLVFLRTGLSRQHFIIRF
jgi:predicted O-methyltransferase YrrM